MHSEPVPELTALLPSRHQNLQSDLHSTLLRENDADVRVETLEHEVSKENLGHGGDKEHLEALSWNVVVGDSGCLDGGETANEKGRLEDLDRG